MASHCNTAEHGGGGIAPLFSPVGGNLLRVNSRRWFLQTGLTGMAGLSLPMLLQQHAAVAKAGKPKSKKNVILFWLSGGPSHIDMWDPKHNVPSEIRGPFDSIPTKVPGVRVSEHLPLTAKLTPSFAAWIAVPATRWRAALMTARTALAIRRWAPSRRSSRGQTVRVCRRSSGWLTRGVRTFGRRAIWVARIRR